MFKLDLKGRETKDQLQISFGSLKKQQSSRKTSTSALFTMPKPMTLWITNKLWKILNEKEILDHLTRLLRNLYAGQEATVRTGQQTDSKQGKEYVKAVFCHPAFLTYMQSTTC